MGFDTGLKRQHRLVARSIFQMQQWDKNTSGEATSKEEEPATSALTEATVKLRLMSFSPSPLTPATSAENTSHKEDVQNCWIYVCK